MPAAVAAVAAVALVAIVACGCRKTCNTYIIHTNQQASERIFFASAGRCAAIKMKLNTKCKAFPKNKQKGVKKNNLKKNGNENSTTPAAGVADRPAGKP